MLRRWIVAFGRFWFDFLIGDTPELFVGTLVTLGVIYAIFHGAHGHRVAEIAFPVLVVAMLVGTVLRERRRQRK